MRVGGAWKYLFRTVDKTGRMIDFTLLDRRNSRSAHRFLAPRPMRNWQPVSITTDKLGSCRKAIGCLQRDNRLSDDVMHRMSTTKDFEIMRMIRRGHYILQKPDAAREIRFIDKLFGLAA